MNVICKDTSELSGQIYNSVQREDSMAVPVRSVKIKCSMCQQTLRVSDRIAGTTRHCLQCGAAVSIPERHEPIWSTATQQQRF